MLTSPFYLILQDKPSNVLEVEEFDLFVEPVTSTAANSTKPADQFLLTGCTTDHTADDDDDNDLFRVVDVEESTKSHDNKGRQSKSDDKVTTKEPVEKPAKTKSYSKKRVSKYK